MGTGAETDRGLRWRGMLADASVTLRRIVAGGLALACITTIITQWGYVGFQFASGAVSYIMLMLMPVAAIAMLLGTLAGAAAGAFVGATLYIHYLLRPLDYYEFTYVTPITSIVLPTLCGLFLGLLFSFVISKHEMGKPCKFQLTLACFGVSCAYTIGFYLSTRQLPYAAQEFTGSAAVFQAVWDTVIFAAASLPVYTVVNRSYHGSADTGLRIVFSAWLSALVLVAYMLVVNMSYEQVTDREYGAAATHIRDEVEFVRDQVLLLMPHDAKDHSISGDAPSLLASMFAGYTEDADGLLVVAQNDTVVGSDAERIVPGQSLRDVFDEDILASIDKSAAEGTLEGIIYVGPSATSDFFDVTLYGTEERFAKLLTRQVGYLMAEEVEGYKFILIRPINMVFAGRDDVMGWVFFTSLVLLVVAHALTWQLLSVMVARRIEATNAVLERITEGDLDSRVKSGGSSEFQSLSKGINTTVDALKGWIHEAENRMDAELATAKVIQESALPNVFPPYPDIQRFDIYASMNAAREVGGDFYDFFLVGDDCGPDTGKLAFVMADVSGKGVPAALFMMKAKTQIRDYLASGMELGEAVENANHQLCEGNEEGMFVTAWIGILDYATGHINFVNAGHNPPLLWKEDRWMWVKQRSGLPLGLYDEMYYRTYSMNCAVGDQILLYTDGVTEAFSADGEQYGDLRLERLVNECDGLNPRELISRVRHSVAAFAQGAEQSDDITMLSLEVGVPPEEKAQLLVMAQISEIDLVMDFLMGELDRRLCPMRVQHQLEIAVEELFVNQCKYAYEGMGPDAERYVRVTYSYSVDPKSLTVELIDSGVPFDPLAKPDAIKAREGLSLHELPIGGLGILMARKNVDEMRYERVGDTNVVTLVKCW